MGRRANKRVRAPHVLPPLMQPAPASLPALARADPRSRTRIGDDGRLVPNLELHRAIEDFCTMQARQAAAAGPAGAAGGGGVASGMAAGQQQLLAGLSRLGSLGGSLGGLEQVGGSGANAGAHRGAGSRLLGGAMCMPLTFQAGSIRDA